MPLPSPAELSALANVGGWLFASVVLALVIGGFIRGDIVPGWIHKREMALGDKSTELLAQMTAAMDRNTSVLDTVVGQQTVMVGLLSGKR
jgi:hypothetical protein